MGAQCYEQSQNYFMEDDNERCDRDGMGCYCKENVRTRNCQFANHLTKVREDFDKADKMLGEAKSDADREIRMMVFKDSEEALIRAEMDCNGGDYTFCRSDRHCDVKGGKVCFDT